MDLAKLLIGINPGPHAPEREEPAEADPLVEMAADEVLASIERKDAKRLVRSLRALMRAMREG